MNKNNAQLYIKKLADMDKKIQEIDDALKNLHSEIHGLLWELIEASRKRQSKQQK